jgi:hypothetical protein
MASNDSLPPDPEKVSPSATPARRLLEQVRQAAEVRGHTEATWADFARWMLRFVRGSRIGAPVAAAGRLR